MNNLSKEKQQQIAFVVMITLIVAAGIWFGLISSQKKRLVDAQRKTAAAKEKVESAQKLLKQTEQIQAELAEVQADLRKREETMASGDYYQWFLSRMIAATSSRPLSNFANPGQPSFNEVTLIPKFPYRSATFSVKINGHFHDLGRFIADIENQFPYARLQNLEMTPAPNIGNEQLLLGFDFVTLYHTNRVTGAQ